MFLHFQFYLQTDHAQSILRIQTLIMPPAKNEPKDEKKPYEKPEGKVRTSMDLVGVKSYTQTPRKEWTEEEEAVWREVLEKTIRQHLLAAVRDDGRLESRRNSIKSHMNALVSSTFDLISPQIGNMKRSGLL